MERDESAVIRHGAHGTNGWCRISRPFDLLRSTPLNGNARAATVFEGDALSREHGAYYRPRGATHPRAAIMTCIFAILRSLEDRERKRVVEVATRRDRCWCRRRISHRNDGHGFSVCASVACDPGSWSPKA
jgi:hypothetical protein